MFLETIGYNVPGNNRLSGGLLVLRIIFQFVVKFIISVRYFSFK